jgi:Flp pilus assembly protein TadB
MKSANLREAIRYAPAGFGVKLLGAIGVFLGSALAAAGVLSVTEPTVGLWIWFGASIGVGLIMFAVGVGDALNP